MPMMKVRTALAGNGTADVLVGQLFETLPFNANVEIGIATDAVGVLATVQSGSDTLGDEIPVTVKAINTSPVYPDDFDLQDVAAQGEKLRIKLRDTSGAARVVMTTVKITAL